MRVKELIKMLKQYPDDMMVVLAQGECGFANVNNSYETLLNVDFFPKPYYIRHVGVTEYTENPTKALVIR
jgi:hypothetical protein